MVYKFADIPVEIEASGEYFQKICGDYIAKNEQPLFKINITDEDIEFEQSRAEENAKFQKSYLEYIAIYRKFCEKAIEYNVILMHGSVVAVDGKAYMFSAPSGTGKSTHASLWRKVFKDRVKMVNDDKPLLKLADGKIYAYGTPWDGKHRLSTNMRAPLEGICFLHQAQKNEIKCISADEALKYVMNQVYRPTDPLMMMKTLDYVEELLKKVPVYSMGCNMLEEAAIKAYDKMKRG